MVKMVILLTRKEGWTHEEFVDYLHEEHAPLAAELPGLQKYTTSVPESPENSEYDGVSELQFESMAAVKSAFDSDVGEEVLADADEFVDSDERETLYLEETVHVDRSD